MNKEVDLVAQTAGIKNKTAANKLVSRDTLEGILAMLAKNMVSSTEELAASASQTYVSFSKECLSLSLTTLVEEIKAYSTKEEADIEKHAIYCETAYGLVEKYEKSISKEDLSILIGYLKESIQVFLNNQEDSEYPEGEQTIGAKAKTLHKIATFFFKEVVTSLLSLFTPGQVPDILVVHSFIRLAEDYPHIASTHLSEVLSRTLPILGSIESDELKLAFSQFFGKLSQSIVEEKGADEQGNTLISTCFDLVKAKWVLNSEETRLEYIEALLLMASVLPHDNQQTNLDEILSIFLENSTANLEDNILLTKAFFFFLETTADKFTIRIGRKTVEIIKTVFNMISTDQFSPYCEEFDVNTIKLKTEAFKVFNLIFSKYFEVSFTFLLNKLDSESLIDRLTTLNVMKFVLIKQEKVGNSEEELISANLSKATHEQDEEFKLELAELINIILEKGFIKAEKTDKLLSFLLRECCYQEEASSSNLMGNYAYVSTNRKMRDKCENILLNLSKNVKSIFTVNLLEFLVDFKFDNAFFILAKLILNNEPKISPEETDCNALVFIKLFIISLDPPRRKDVNTLVKDAMKVLLGEITSLKGVSELTDNIRNRDSIDEDAYFKIFIDFWTKEVESIKDKKLFSAIAEHVNDSLTVYKDRILVSKGLIALQGVLLSRSDKEETIKNKLDGLFSLIHPEYRNSVIDGNKEASFPPYLLVEGVSQAFGIIAKNHLDLVLDKVNSLFQSKIQYEKPKGFFAGMFAKDEIPMSQEIKSSLISILGSVASYSQINSLRSRISSNFLAYIDKFFKDDSSTLELKVFCLKSYNKIFSALEKLSSNNNEEPFKLPSRDEYLTRFEEIYDKISEPDNVKTLSLECIGRLIKLDPPVNMETLKRLLIKAIEYVDFCEEVEHPAGVLKAVGVVFEGALTFDSVKSDSELSSSDFTDEWTNMLSYEEENLTNWALFSYILEKCLERTALFPSIKVFMVDLIEILVNSKKTVSVQHNDKKYWTCSIVALFSLFADDEVEDKHTVFSCFQRLLAGVKIFDVSFTMIIEEFTPQLASSLSKALSEGEIMKIVDFLFVTLKSKSSSVKQHSSELIIFILEMRKTLFTAENKDSFVIFTKAIETLEELESRGEEEENLQFVVDIAEKYTSSNLIPVIEYLISNKFELPYSKSVIALLNRVCKEKSRMPTIFSKLTDTINNSNPGTEDKPNHEVNNATEVIATILSLKNDAIVKMIQKFFPQLLSTLILRLGSSHSSCVSAIDQSNQSDPRMVSIRALEYLIPYSEKEEMQCLLNSSSMTDTLLSQRDFDEGIYQIIHVFCKTYEHSRQQIMFEFLKGFSERPYEGQRVIVITCFAQFLKNSSEIRLKEEFDIAQWRKSLVEQLSNAISDPKEKVRKQAIRGLSNLCYVYIENKENLDEYIEKVDPTAEICESVRKMHLSLLKSSILDEYLGNTVVNLLVDKLGDPEEGVIHEVLMSLMQMVEFLSLKILLPCLNGLLVKLRPCFDTSNGKVRMMAFNLFSRLFNLTVSHSEEVDSESQTRQTLREQVHVHFVSLVVHCDDEDDAVRKACFKALSRGLCLIVDVEEEKKESYEEILDWVVERVCRKYPDRVKHHMENCVNHAESNQAKVKSAAVLLAARLWKTVVKEDIQCGIDLEEVFKVFSKLLGEGNAKVQRNVINSLRGFEAFI